MSGVKKNDLVSVLFFFESSSDLFNNVSLWFLQVLSVRTQGHFYLALFRMVMVK